jgi:hypothetical protein
MSTGGQAPQAPCRLVALGAVRVRPPADEDDSRIATRDIEGNELCLEPSSPGRGDDVTNLDY